MPIAFSKIICNFAFVIKTGNKATVSACVYIICTTVFERELSVWQYMHKRRLCTLPFCYNRRYESLRR